MMESSEPTRGQVMAEGVRRFWSAFDRHSEIGGAPLHVDPHSATHLLDDLSDEVINYDCELKSGCELIPRTELIASGSSEGSEKVPRIDPQSDQITKDDEAGGFSLIGQDIPVVYQVRGLKSHELPVVGTHVDPRIVPGFCYQVRLLDQDKFLFEGSSLLLKSVGRGYGKRITFEGGSLNFSDNVFWSDSNPSGYGFSLILIRPSEDFTLKDSNENSLGAVKVLRILKPSMELHQKKPNDESCVEKEAEVSLVCSFEQFDERIELPKEIRITGVAVAARKKGRPAATLEKVKHCYVDGKRGFALTPGISNRDRITRVNGGLIGDIPTEYSIAGLESFEFPIIGTYIHPRIIPGFKYRVRPANSRHYLFCGQARTLLSVGRGYGKKLTFSGRRLNNPEDYFWSDNHPEGYALSIEAVSVGDKFKIWSSEREEIGEALVIRTDLAQEEEGSRIVSGGVVKRVRVTVTCDVSFYGVVDTTIFVTGSAVVHKRANSASVDRIEDVAVGSRLNTLFSASEETLMFVAST